MSSLGFSRDNVLVPVRPPTGQHGLLCPAPGLPGTQASSMAAPPHGGGAPERLSRLLDITALRLLILDGSREPSQHGWHWSSRGDRNSQLRSLPPCGIPISLPENVKVILEGDGRVLLRKRDRVWGSAVAAAGPSSVLASRWDCVTWRTGRQRPHVEEKREMKTGNRQHTLL